MRQAILTITCDECGCQQTFETLRAPAEGPIVTTRDPEVMLKRNGWVAIEVTGFRGADVCGQCWAMRKQNRLKSETDCGEGGE